MAAHSGCSHLSYEGGFPFKRVIGFEAMEVGGLKSVLRLYVLS